MQAYVHALDVMIMEVVGDGLGVVGGQSRNTNDQNSLYICMQFSQDFRKVFKITF